MAFSISFIVQAVDKFSSVARTIGKSFNYIEKKAGLAAKAIEKLNNGGLSKLSRQITEAGKNAFVKLTLPIGGLAAVSLTAAASLETMQVSFDTLLQSKDKGAKMMQDIMKFAQLTPFEMEDIGNSVRQLLGANVPLEEIITSLTMIADVAAGVNVPLTDMTHIIAKSKNKAKAQAEELNQMAERGIPIMQELARMSGRSTAEVYKAAEEGKITYDVILAAFKNMTKQGGMFYKMSENQSQTLTGLWSTLKDVLYFARGDIGDAIVDAFDLKKVMKDSIAWLEKMQIKMKAFIKENPNLTKFIIIIAAITSMIAPFLLALGMAVKMIQFMGIAVKVLSIAFKLMFMNPIGLAIGAVALLVLGIIYLYNKSETFRKVMNGVGIVIWAVLEGIWGLAKALFKILNPLNILVTIGKFLYNNFYPFKCLVDSIAAIFNNWPNIIDKVVASLNKLGNIIKPFFDNAAKNIALMPAAAPGASSSAISNKSTFERVTGVNKSTASVNININDKNNNVKSVDYYNKGFSQMSVGKNMGQI